MRRVHEQNNYKKKEHLITTFWRPGWMSLKLTNMIKRLCKECYRCHRFGIRVNWPTRDLFNQVVTLYPNEMGSKYIL